MVNNQFSKAILAAVVLTQLLWVGCGQLSSLQTGRVLDDGEAVVGGAVLGYGISDPDAGGGDLGSGVFPHVEIFGRYGLGSNLDIGGKLSTGGNLLIDAKYQLLGTAGGDFAVSLGGGFEYQGTNPTENVVLRGHFPIYLSYHPSERAAVYATPRYVYQYVSDDDNSYFLGGGLGFQYDLSERLLGMVEGSYFRPFTENTNGDNPRLFLFGAGLALRLGK